LGFLGFNFSTISEFKVEDWIVFIAFNRLLIRIGTLFTLSLYVLNLSFVLLGMSMFLIEILVFIMFSG